MASSSAEYANSSVVPSEPSSVRVVTSSASSTAAIGSSLASSLGRDDDATDRDQHDAPPRPRARRDRRRRRRAIDRTVERRGPTPGERSAAAVSPQPEPTGNQVAVRPPAAARSRRSPPTPTPGAAARRLERSTTAARRRLSSASASSSAAAGSAASSASSSAVSSRAEFAERGEGDEIVDAVVHATPPSLPLRRCRSAAHSTLDGAEREAEPLGDVGVAESLDEGELDDLALVGRQVGQRPSTPFGVERGDGRVVGGVLDVGAAATELFDPVALRLFRADPVDRPSPSDRDRPRRHRRLASGSKRAAGVQSSTNTSCVTSSDIAGSRRIRLTRTEDHRGDGVVELGEGILIAALHALEERRRGRVLEDLMPLMMPGTGQFDARIVRLRWDAATRGRSSRPRRPDRHGLVRIVGPTGSRNRSADAQTARKPEASSPSCSTSTAEAECAPVTGNQADS